jgi:hypothetical protein
MATFPTNINLSDTTPPAKPDALNVEWQGDVPVPDPNSPGTYVRNASACYRYPKVGGIQVVIDDYQFSEVDSGFTFIINSSSAVTLTMPAAPPMFTSPAEGVWFIKIKNIGTGTLTLDPNGMNVDASTSTFTIPQNSGFTVSTDSTDYWTSDNFSAAPSFADAEVPSGTINGSNTSFTLAHTPLATPIVEEDGLLPTRGAGSFGYTLSGTSLIFTDAPQRSVHLWYRY